jgi:Ca2+-binding RTX toxin-like protein
LTIQTTDIHKTALDDHGIVITGAVTSWTVAPNVVVASDLGNGVETTQNSSTLFNFGAISSSKFLGYGVHFESAGGVIYNGEEAIISGYYGIGTEAANVSTTNFGSIVGEKYAFVFDQASSFNKLDNRGFIFSEEYGVVDSSHASGGNTISNNGTIEGLSGGLGIASAPGLVTHLVNSGTIRGFASIVGAGVGALDLQNAGKLIGDILLTATENDTLVNSGSIGGAVHLGSGNDIFNGTGGTSGAVFGEGGNDTLTGGSAADTLDGGAGNDTIAGGLGADTLTGGAGVDKLNGGLGNDRLTGGAGIDAFVFDTKPNAATNRDLVTDFQHGVDKFQLENSVFTKLGNALHLNPAFFHLGTAAADANDHIIYDRAHGNLFYDSNGNTAGGVTLFAVLTTHPVLTAADFLVI